MFGEASYDLTDTITATAGVRGFNYHNTLVGFFGFGRNPGNGFSDGPPNAAGSNRTGVAQCFTRSGERLYDRDSDTYSSSLTLLPPVVDGSPCTNLGVYNTRTGTVDPVKGVGSGVTYRFNVQWKPSTDFMLYGTFSRGFRPGGINRRADVAPYAPDFLVNYELGWKTTPVPGLRLNGAIYQQEWQKFQFSFLGENSFTEIHNGPNARIRGMELDLAYNTGGLNLSLAGAYTDAKTLQNLCDVDDPTFACAGPDNGIAAPVGTRLPITPKWKLSGTARYTIESGSAKYYGQVNAAYQGAASSDIRVGPAAVIGSLPAFTRRQPGDRRRMGQAQLRAVRQPTCSTNAARFRGSSPAANAPAPMSRPASRAPSGSAPGSSSEREWVGLNGPPLGSSGKRRLVSRSAARLRARPNSAKAPAVAGFPLGRAAQWPVLAPWRTGSSCPPCLAIS